MIPFFHNEIFFLAVFLPSSSPTSRCNPARLFPDCRCSVCDVLVAPWTGPGGPSPLSSQFLFSFSGISIFHLVSFPPVLEHLPSLSSSHQFPPRAPSIGPRRRALEQLPERRPAFFSEIIHVLAARHRTHVRGHDGLRHFTSRQLHETRIMIATLALPVHTTDAGPTESALVASKPCASTYLSHDLLVADLCFPPFDS